MKQKLNLSLFALHTSLQNVNFNNSAAARVTYKYTTDRDIPIN